VSTLLNSILLGCNLANRTWMYVACAAEYYYYTTTLVKELTN